VFPISKIVLGCAVALWVQSTIIGQVTSNNTDSNDRVQTRLDRLEAELSTLKSTAGL
jgi:mannose/fructose/N-acetylgalactosamine-specific phosphotransferase system component IID